jgi:hypothetical protein
MSIQLTLPRALLIKAHLLEIIISAAAIGLGVFMWVSMSSSNLGINTLAGAGGRAYRVYFCDQIDSQV